jgi:heme o synthase
MMTRLPAVVLTPGLRGCEKGSTRLRLTVSHSPEVVQRPATPPVPGWRSAAATVRSYLLLTKPRIVELLLVTTVPAMVLAAGELPSLSLIAAVLFGGALAAGGANTLNCWIERDRDQMMQRTHRRPLPAGAIAPRDALVFGLALEGGAFAWLLVTVNLLAAALAVSAMLFYVFVYTIWLKPRSPQNIVIGGAAGAVPVLVGWAAVTGQLDAPAWVLFAIVFCWTPPHFWALALRYRDDYATAGIPMLPVVRGPRAAAGQILVYTVIVVGVTLALFRFEEMGVVYLLAALGLGAAFVAQAVGLRRDATPARAMRLFGFSNAYLALLFAAIAVDTLVRTS